jgi:hypothetical protein
MPRRALPGAALLTPSLLAETARRHVELGAVIERSRDLLWWGRQRRSSVAVHLRTIRGGVGGVGVADVANLITSTITGASLCAECIAKKIDVPSGRVKLTLIRISTTLKVTSGGAGCDACRISAKVFRLASESRSSPAAVVSLRTETSSPSID